MTVSKSSVALLIALAGSALANDVSAATYFQWQYVVAAVVILLSGALVCFFGYRLFRTVIVAIGFVIGFGVCYSLLVAYAGMEEWANILISIIPGLAVAILMHLVYRAAVFTCGFLAGFLALSAVVYGFVGTYVTDDQVWFEVTYWVLLTVICVLCGAGALFFEKIAIVVATAFIGAYGCTVALDYFVYIDDAQFATVTYNVFAGNPVNFDTQWIAYVMLAVWIVGSLVGVMYQLRSTRNYTPPSRSSERVVIISPGV